MPPFPTLTSAFMPYVLLPFLPHTFPRKRMKDDKLVISISYGVKVGTGEVAQPLKTRLTTKKLRSEGGRLAETG